jgi:ferredoxin-type protein NapF
MAIDFSKRGLLFGRNPLLKQTYTPRPPWANSDFLDQCTRCGACVSACPTQIVIVGDGGFPQVDFSQGECTFCGDCQSACEPKILTATIPWPHQIAIGTECLAQQQVDCRVCGEICDVSAIRFVLSAGSVAKPVVNEASCTGCGACIAPCPSAAIRIDTINEGAV